MTQYCILRTPIYYLTRNFCSSTTNFNKASIQRARVMGKLLGSGGKKRKSWYNNEDFDPMPKSSGPKTGINHRRINVLNKLFMSHITNLMSTGEVASEIVGKGIQISRVQVTSDFNKVNVFWLAKGTEDDIKVEEILKKSAWEIRHELTQLRVIGIVPVIEFVKDKEYAKIVEVDRLLAVADFGEDYVPVDHTWRLKFEFTLSAPLPPNIKQNIKSLEQSETVGSSEQPLPAMRMDVFGLRHSEIMNKVKASMKKSQAVHRHDPSHSIITNNELSQHSNSSSLEDIAIKLRKEDFKKFLIKRQIMRKKALRVQRNFRPELELYNNEILEATKLDSEYVDCLEEEKDYIEESEN